MPVDPVTGQPLPYPGEPGYEEAMAANPDAYAQGGGPPPPGGMAPPMPPGAPGELGPPPGEMAPPPGAGPGPEETAAAMDQEAAARVEAMAAAAPVPEKPFAVKAIQTMIGQFNDTIDAMGGEGLPDVEWAAPEGGAKWENPLPGEIFVPMVALNEALKLVEGGEFYEKYPLDPEEITSYVELRKSTALLKKMEKDKGLSDVMQAPVGGAPEGEEMEEELPPAPGGMTEEDEMLAAGLT